MKSKVNPAQKEININVKKKKKFVMSYVSLIINLDVQSIFNFLDKLTCMSAPPGRKNGSNYKV